MTEESTYFSSKPSYKDYKPHITILVVFISITLFIGINLDGNLETKEVYERWGAPSAMSIFDGSYWGLLTSSFLHTAIWHIGFNLYWIWIFGKKIEYESSKSTYIFLIASGSLVSSFAQLGFGNAIGIGLSGVGYAFFGYLLVKSKTSEEFRGFLDKRTIQLFLVWLVVCVVLTELDILLIGNAAHIAGLIWGMSIAYVSKFHWSIGGIIGTTVFMFIALSVFWNPFSTTWLSYQAYHLHEKQQLEEAITKYEEILNRDADNEFALVNLSNLETAKIYEQAYELHKQQRVDEAIVKYKEVLERDPDNKYARINLDQLETTKRHEKAFKLHSEKKYAEARAAYRELLELDSTDEWARTNLSQLPKE